MKTFSELFRRYRLRAEFETFAAFGDSLAEKGYFYEESIFSHWQKGTRVPSNRQLVLKILEVFVERKAVSVLEEANELLVSAGMGYLTEKEKAELHLKDAIHSPFQVPTDVIYFTGRERILKKLQKELIHGNIFLLHGPAGVGKTALAIRLGHLLREKFSDGVLWYKADSSNTMDILLSIARLFGEDISSIKNADVRASTVRALLSKKKVLLIFDNVTIQDQLSLLLPNSDSCCIIFTSQESSLNLTNYIPISLSAFSEDEVLELFKKVFGNSFVAGNKRLILAISEKLGNLPLAVHVAAAYIKRSKLPLQTYLKQLDNELVDLQTFGYEDKNLLRAITISFDMLDKQAQNVFVSLCVFEGKDFSEEAVAFINKFSMQEAKRILSLLQAVSFVDRSDNGRFRIHPLVKLFARKKMKDSSLYLRAAIYYEKFLSEAHEKYSQKYLMQETDNLIYIFRKCYDGGYWDQVITMWNPVEKFLKDINEVKKLRLLTDAIDTAPSINKLQKVLTVYMIFMLIYWVILFFSGLKTSLWNYFGGLWFLIPLIGGFLGILRSRSWGLFNTNIGKAIFFISAGLFSWGSGNVIWVYYNFFQKIDVPYPSLGDIGFFVAGVFWIIGIVYLSQATGAKFDLRHMRGRLFFIVIPITVIIFSYYFLLFIVKRTFDSDTPLKIFLDLAYPSMDIIILTIALTIFGLSVNFFRGKYRLSLFTILGGFVCLYIADFTAKANITKKRRMPIRAKAFLV